MDDLQLSLFLLICLSIISWWIAPRWVAAIGAALSAGYAYWLGYVDGLGLLVLAGIGLMLRGYYTVYKLPELPKLALAIVLIGATFTVYLHYMPGFYNFMAANQIRLSPASSPYTAYVNIDKALVGLIFLLYFPAFNRSLKEWLHSARFIPLPLLIVSLLLIGSAYAINYIQFDPKVPSILWWWIPLNLLFVCVAEEVFYRGFIQRELSNALSNYKYGQMSAIILTAIICGAAHYRGGISFVFLSGLAAIIYGYVFVKSQRLETSILIHFFVNLIHILTFSYPSLSR
ncbi:MAG: CPBP family intramembrane metalloprotease [Candidatus Paracaedibacteraceae bacterium]|nr:CPBP family intramembrane metalloprotease [Candidatus Paracaedibacteraceae bacterium]